VSDPEDGESKYDEIPSDDVLLQLIYIKGTVRNCDCYEDVIPEEPVGLSLMRNSDCFTCHQFKTKLIGPSFQEIAARYASKTSARALLASRIKEGSMGVWGDIMMPGHPEISKEAANNIVDWVLQKGDKPGLNYLIGKEGSLRLEIPTGSGRGYFLLHAMYTDRGVPDKPEEKLTGSDIIVVQHH
jgi:cytochrome c